MLGTIHALPRDTQWRSAAASHAIASADLLVVEIADLDNAAKLAEAFAALGAAPKPESIAARIAPDLRGELDAIVRRGQLDPNALAALDTWAAALTLARVDTEGDPAGGVDRAVIRAFAARPVRELEGADYQLAIFDRLPESEQRDLLDAVVREAQAARSDPERLRRAWLAGDVAELEQAARTGIMADPELREALLLARNRRWDAMIAPLLEDAPRPLIAVGAAHLVGPDGLQRRLEARGYRVRRLR